MPWCRPCRTSPPRRSASCPSTAPRASWPRGALWSLLPRVAFASRDAAAPHRVGPRHRHRAHAPSFDAHAARAAGRHVAPDVARVEHRRRSRSRPPPPPPPPPPRGTAVRGRPRPPSLAAPSQSRVRVAATKASVALEGRLRVVVERAVKLTASASRAPPTRRGGVAEPVVDALQRGAVDHREAGFAARQRARRAVAEPRGGERRRDALGERDRDAARAPREAASATAPPSTTSAP